MKKNPEQIARIYKNLGDRIDYTLTKLVEDNKPIAPALATAEQNYLKLHGADDAIEQEAAEEAAAAVSFTFEPRITLSGADASLEAMCEAWGLVLDDYGNIVTRARREAAKCTDESEQHERANYFPVQNTGD
jgi:hypothetical protein